MGIGWNKLCKYGNKYNLTYEEFKVLIIFISALLIRRTIKYLVDDYKMSTMCWSLYMIYPALLDLIQVRFFLAEAIVIFSFRFLVEGKTSGYLKYILGVMIAYTVHSSAIFYLLFLLAIILNGDKKKLIYIVSVICSLFCIVGKKYIIMIASLIFNQERITRYFYSTEAVGFWGVIAYTLTLFLFINVASSICIIEKNSENELSKKFFDCLYGCNIISTLIMPLTLFDTNFFRVQRIMWVFLYISLGILIKDNIKSINIFNININTGVLGLIISILGGIFYICTFNFDIVQGILL